MKCLPERGCIQDGDENLYTSSCSVTMQIRSILPAKTLFLFMFTPANR